MIKKAHKCKKKKKKIQTKQNRVIKDGTNLNWAGGNN